jgi:hypothetical protein
MAFKENKRDGCTIADSKDIYTIFARPRATEGRPLPASGRVANMIQAWSSLRLQDFSTLARDI